MGCVNHLLMAKKEDKLKLRDILAPIIPGLIDRLMQISGKTQEELGEDIGGSSTISRYRKGKVMPLANLPKLGAAAGLGIRVLGLQIGLLLVEKNQAYATGLSDPTDEVRESEASYDKRRLADELADKLAEIMTLDFRVFGIPKTVELNLEREKLRKACEAVLSANESLVEACEANEIVVEGHRELVSSFKDRCLKALHQAHGS